MRDRNIYGVLASPVRRRILELLRNGSLTAGDIASEFKVNRQPFSEHLPVLRNSGLVLVQIRGRPHVYHPNALPVAETDIWLHSFERHWEQHLRAVSKILGRENRK